jgi:hypothetical protein
MLANWLGRIDAPGSTDAATGRTCWGLSAPDIVQVGFVLLTEIPPTILQEADDFNIFVIFRRTVQFSPAQHGHDGYSLTAFGEAAEDHPPGLLPSSRQILKSESDRSRSDSARGAPENDLCPRSI